MWEKRHNDDEAFIELLKYELSRCHDKSRNQ